MNDIEIIEKITKLEQHGILVDEQIADLKKITNEIHIMSESLVRLTEQMKTASNDIKQIKTDLSKIEEEPSKKWNDLTKTIITAVVSGLIALTISLIFK